MSEKIPLCNAPLFVLAQVDGLLPLVERLAPASTSEYLDGGDGLTERGWRGAEIAHRVALDSFRELEPLSGSYPSPTPDHDRLGELIYHATRVTAVAGAALAGLKGHPEPTTVTWGIEEMLESLRVEAEAAREVEGRVFDYDRGVSTTVDTDEPEEGSGWSITCDRDAEHPAIRRARAEGRTSLTADDVFAVLVDAYRPLVTYLRGFDDFSLEDDPIERAKALRDGLHIARESAELAWGLHYGVDRAVASDWINRVDRLVVVAHAIDGLTRARGLSAEGFGSPASAISCMVRHTYEAVLTEEVAHA